MTVWRGLVVSTHPGEVLQSVRLGAEPVHRRSGAPVGPSQQDVSGAIRAEAIGPVGIGEVLLQLKGKWFQEEVPEAHIGEVAPSFHMHQQGHMIERRAEALATCLVHLTLDTVQAESEILQQRGEQAIELVAESTTSLPNDLVIEPLRVQFDGDPGADVEILERDVQKMCPMKRLQTVGIRGRRSAQPDALQ